MLPVEQHPPAALAALHISRFRAGDARHIPTAALLPQRPYSVLVCRADWTAPVRASRHAALNGCSPFSRRRCNMRVHVRNKCVVWGVFPTCTFLQRAFTDGSATVDPKSRVRNLNWSRSTCANTRLLKLAQSPTWSVQRN